MTEQQYRVIADRDEGDDPKVSDLNAGDRATVLVMNDDPACDQVVRIERPVPTTDGDEWEGVSTDRLRDMADLLDGLLNRATLRQAADELDRLRASSPQPPTREQIVRVLIGYYGQDIDIVTGQSVEQDAATDLLALIQNGADR